MIGAGGQNMGFFKRYKEKIDEFKKAKAMLINYENNAEVTPGFKMLTLDRPVWHYGLLSPDWLLPERIRSTKVGIISYVDISLANINNPIIQLEDEVGRLTRSIPLMLLETLLYFSDHEPFVMIPVAAGMGPIVSNKEVDDNYLKEVAAKHNLDYVITGSILLNGTEYSISNRIYSSAEQTVSVVKTDTSGAKFGQSCIEMISDIHAKLGCPIPSEIEQNKMIYKIPKPAQFSEYLSALGQLLMQSLITKGVASIEGLKGERDMLNCYLGLALADPENQIFRVMLVSGMEKSKSCNSKVYKEFKQQAISLLSEKNESNYSRRLLPFVYNMFGMKNESIKQKNLLLSTIQDETYCRWLEQISTDNLTSAASPQE